MKGDHVLLKYGEKVKKWWCTPCGISEGVGSVVRRAESGLGARKKKREGMMIDRRSVAAAAATVASVAVGPPAVGGSLSVVLCRHIFTAFCGIYSVSSG